MAGVTLGELRVRLAELRRARTDLPPHSAQGLRGDLDDRIASLERQVAARSERAAQRPPHHPD